MKDVFDMEMTRAFEERDEMIQWSEDDHRVKRRQQKEQMCTKLPIKRVIWLIKWTEKVPTKEKRIKVTRYSMREAMNTVDRKLLLTLVPIDTS